MFSLFSWNKKEFLGVLSIVGVIFLVSFYQLRIGEMKTRDSQRRSDTELVARSLKEYFKQYGQYPRSLEGKILSCGSRGIDACEWGDSTFVDDDSVVYLQNMPKDPKSYQGFSYVYEVDQSRKNFKIYARLEYEGDPVVRKGLTVECGNGLQCNWVVES